MLRLDPACGLLVAVALAVTPACGTATAVRATAGSAATTTSAVAVVPAPAPPPASSPPPVTRARAVSEQAWAPFAAAGAVTLLHPAQRVERVAFHQSSHDGARELTVLTTASAPMTLDDRHRDTGARTAADVVVDPGAEIRAPVTGRVKRAGTYVLYCRHRDDYVVIEPDGRPGWEVKILHIDGVRVRPGSRVVAGRTVLAPRATELPFQSQVDEFRTAEPAWPHVHIEVVDPSIPDRPSPNPCT